MGAIEDVEKDYLRTDIPEFRPGDTVVVKVKIKEADKERVQAFEGVVIRKRGCDIRTTFTVRKVSYGVGVERIFTVRKVSYGVGVERIFPLHSPAIESVKIKSRGKVRRSRLYYLRGLKGKAARLKTRR
jgi:large subunit ribosomal protein L19